MIDSPVQFKIAATSAETGEAIYFDKHDMKENDYRVICASSCTPLYCKPYKLDGSSYFDGYVSDPIPVEKALSDGCDKLVILLTLLKDHMRSRHSFERQAEKTRKYPAISSKLLNGAGIYNQKLKKCLSLEKEGKALLLSTYALDCKPFSELYDPDADLVTWNDSSLRAWLNSHFLDSAFEPWEQDAIVSKSW